MKSLWTIVFFAITIYAQEYTAYSQPYSEVEVASEEAGVIDKIYVREGDTVQKGQLLARLRNRELSVLLQIAKTRLHNKGEIASQKALLSLHEKTLQRLLELKKGNYTSNSEIEQAHANVEVTKARLFSAQEQKKIEELEVERIQAQLERSELKSPINGIVRKIFYQPGERITENKPGVLQVVQIDTLLVTVHVLLAQANHLQLRQPAQVLFTGTSSPTKGMIHFIDPIADAASGTVKVQLLIDNSNFQCRGGVRCSVVFAEKIKKNLTK